MAANAPAAVCFPRKVVMMDSYKHWKQPRRVRSIECAVETLVDSGREHGGTKTHVEVLEPAEDGTLPLAKFYFDFDDGTTHTVEPSEEHKAETYEHWADMTRTLMVALGVEEPDVAMATRSRYKDGMYKMSAHAVVQGYYATVPEIKAVAAALHQMLPETDLAPYKARQTFACVLCCKDAEHTDAADVMRPMMQEGRRPYSDYLIQAFGPDDVRLVVPKHLMERYGVRPMAATYTSADGTVMPVTEGDQQLALELLPLIARQETGDRDTFVTVGHHLHQIFGGSEEGLRAFDAWCAPHPSYKGAAYVADKWRTFAPRASAPLAALRAKAKAHSPERYAELMETRKSQVVEDAKACTRTQRFVDLCGSTGDARLDDVVSAAVVCRNHTSVALIALHMFGRRIVCASKKHALWYEFRDHRWWRDVGGNVIGNALSYEMYDRLDARLTAGNIKARPMVERAVALAAIKDADKTSEQAEEAKALLATLQTTTPLLKSLKVLVNDLRMVGVKTSIISEYASKSVVANRGFVSRLDEKRLLFGFNDGVYDLKAGEFRAGRPEDYVTMSTGYDFPTTDDPEKQAFILKFYDDCAPSPAVAKYDLQATAYNLGGNNYREHLHFYVGHGRNGKGGKFKLVKMAYGDAAVGEDMARGYCYEPDSSILTCKRTSSSSPCPEVVLAQGVRLLVVNEPQGDDKSGFNVALLKGLSGNDPWTGRELHMPPITFQPQFGIFAGMNNVPKLEGADNAFARRLKVVDHPRTFVEDPKLPNERQIDMSLKSKFENDITYAQQFMRILLRIYREDALWDPTRVHAEPAEVNAATREVMEDDDQVREFLAEFGSRDPEAKTRVPDARAQFNEWLRRRDDSVDPMTNVEFNRRMRANGWKQGKPSHSIRRYEGLALAPLPPPDGGEDMGY